MNYLLHKTFIVFICIALLLSVSCKNKLEDINAITFADTFPIEAGKNIEIIYSENAQIQTVLKAPEYFRYGGKNPYSEMPKGIDATFYDSSMKVKTRLTSKYAIKYDNKNTMEAKNDVVVINEKGEQLNTEHLIWNEKERKIYTDVFVKITTSDKVFYGDGMDADDSFIKWVIRKPRGTFYINTEDSETE
ncbi:MAG: LPS export ABC transporter periplasmic protein LptC [Bacteroidales bacterium]|jgi:LPS export ABC transporter protein LptC|nr:LPS export ABC transporter periplasmic protein LptC [Bacteroidales bacterium]MDD4215497.1 LPS export ABC transporter periplasmic protein LptC [Bacteroidales bacterium]